MKTKIRNKKVQRRKRRHMHIRNTVSGTSVRPRISVYRSNAHIYAQVIDDVSGNTLIAVSSLKLEASKIKAPAAAKGDKKKKAPAMGTKVLVAHEVGRLLAESAKEKGITKACFDRGGYLYHGRVAALASGAREAGLDF